MDLAFGGFAAAVALVFSLGAAAAPGETAETVIYRFTGHPLTDRSSQPNSIVAGPGGALYGALAGGRGVFILTPPANGQTQWTETTIPAYGQVYGKPFLRKDGAIYGTTYDGGSTDLGTVFQLTPPGTGAKQWTRTILHTFGYNRGSGQPDGQRPSIGVIAGPGGTVYGVTTRGGTNGGGTVFRLTLPKPGGTQWVHTVLYNFRKSIDCNSYCDAYVPGGLLLGPGGNLFGTTYFGGPRDNGTVYQLTPPKPGQVNWNFTILHNFGDNDGNVPNADLVADANGVLYGTTVYGSGVRGGAGVVFKMTPPTHGEIRWPYNVIYTFPARTGDDGPVSGVLLGRDGALYGSSEQAGSAHACFFGHACGVVFKLTPPPAGEVRWRQTVLHDFTGNNGDTYGPVDVTLGRDPDGSAALFGMGGPVFETGVWGAVFEVKLAP